MGEIISRLSKRSLFLIQERVGLCYFPQQLLRPFQRIEFSLVHGIEQLSRFVAELGVGSLKLVHTLIRIVANALVRVIQSF